MRFKEPPIGRILRVGLLAVVHQAAAQVNFAPATNYFVVSNATSVAAVDVNGDGKVDLICASETGIVTVLTNNGSGGFGSNATYNVGMNFSMVAVDVNGDGKVDLVGANIFGGKIPVLTNNGSGGFALASAPVVGSLPQCVVTADVNGDGKPDLIVAFGGNGPPPAVLTNAGNGIFVGGFSLPPPPPASDSWLVAAADVNRDGKVDVIDLNSPSSGGYSYLRVLTNGGAGTFALCSSNVVASGWPGSLTAVDVRGDGKVDMIVSDNSSGGGKTLELLTNNGAGIFHSNATYTIGQAPDQVIAADVNGDGRLDLISANGFNGSLTVLTNNRNGGFGSNATINIGPFTSLIFAVWVAAADVNGDGKLDLAGAYGGTNRVSVLINNASFPPPTSTPALKINPSGNGVLVSWPSASAGWSLQQNPDLTAADWSPSGYSGYDIADDGTNKSLIVAPAIGNLFFRLLHP